MVAQAKDGSSIVQENISHGQHPARGGARLETATITGEVHSDAAGKTKKKKINRSQTRWTWMAVKRPRVVGRFIVSRSRGLVSMGRGAPV